MRILRRGIFPVLSSLLATCLLLGACAGANKTPETNPADTNTEAQTTAQEKNREAAATSLSFALAGDIMMGTSFPDSVNGSHLPANGGRDVLADVRDLLSNADIAAANLEGTLLDSGGHPKTCRDSSACHLFRMPTAYAANLTDAGLDLLSLANNHSNDFGLPGLESTMQTLRKAEISYAGIKVLCETAYIDRKGLRIGFAAFAPNSRTLSINDYAKAREILAELDSNADLVVISIHGGAEGENATRVPHKEETAFGENRGDVEKFAHFAIDNGADIVFGHGPHVPRAIELYKERIVMYSLGNFATPYRMSLVRALGYAPLVTVRVAPDGAFLDGKIHSFIQQHGAGPKLDKTNAAAKLIKQLSASDFPASPLSIADDGTISRK